MQSDYGSLPENLPKPIDDGACDHLRNQKLPGIELQTTDNLRVNLSDLKGCTVIFCYPMTGRPNEALPENWDQIPGARGCTPQVCCFRDHLSSLKNRVNQLFGYSAHSFDFQSEAKSRLALNYPLFCDENQKLIKALNLPTFRAGGKIFVKRLTLICQDDLIQGVLYPIFPSNKNVELLLNWFDSQSG